MNQSHQSINDLVDIPLPKSREKLDINELYSHRPPPSIGNMRNAGVKSNQSVDALKTISNIMHLTGNWYSNQIKDCPISSLKDTAKQTDIISVLPLLTAYDQRLALAEKAVKSIKKKLDSQSRLDVNFRKECSECNQQVIKSQSLASELDAAKEELSTLKQYNSTVLFSSKDQSEELKWYKDENTFLASQVFELIEKFEQGSKFNNELMKKSDILKKKLENSDTKFQSLLQDYERAVRWITSRKDSIKDYEKCINNLGLENILELSSPDQRGNILSTKVDLTINEISDLKRKLNESNQRYQSITDENNCLIKKFLFEMEKKKTELDVAQARLAEFTHLMDRSQVEKRHAENEVLKASKTSIYMEDHYKHLMRERDDQISDLILKSNNELKMVRDQFNLETSRLNLEIDELKKSKVELQAEVGHLLRDKRRAELDLETVQRNNDIYRAKVIV